MLYPMEGSSQMRFLFLVLAISFFIILQQWESANCAHAESSFVKRNGRNFVVNGSHLYVNGFNSYWMMFVATNIKLPLFFNKLHGLTVARAWALKDGNTYRALQTSPGPYPKRDESLRFGKKT